MQLSQDCFVPLSFPLTRMLSDTDLYRFFLFVCFFFGLFICISGGGLGIAGKVHKVRSD